MLVIIAAFGYCVYNTYLTIKENNKVDENVLLANNVKNFITTIKDVIISINIKDYPDNSGKVIKNFLIDYLAKLEDYPYIQDFNSSDSIKLDSELQKTLSNLDKILIAYNNVDWRKFFTLKANNYYYMSRMNLLDDIKSFINILNSGETNQTLDLDYHCI